MDDQTHPNVLVATAEEASHGAEHIRADKINGAALADIDIEGVRALHCVIMGYETDPGVLAQHERAFVWNDLHGPWLHRCPNDLVEALAVLPQDRFEELGVEWWNKQLEDEEESVKAEMIHDMPVDRLREDVRILVTLAQAAIRKKKNMYWEVPSC